jgi:hypothetical protein
MKSLNLILIGFFGCVLMSGANAAVSKCSKVNLTRCLDSACAINNGTNPAARCQYCGTSAAGTPPVQKGITNITAGQSTKYALTDKELSVAPSDPGRRYMWATTECIKKLPDCTTNDVSTVYDKLIEQSCKSAGVSMQTANAVEKLNTKPTKSKCNDAFSACLAKKCGASFETCEQDSDFDRFISECASDASGCDDYIAEFRKSVTNERKQMYATREKVLLNLVEGYQKSRESKFEQTQTKCTKDTQLKSCTETVCNIYMVDKCEGATEKAMAEQLCKFYKTACTGLK